MVKYDPAADNTAFKRKSEGDTPSESPAKKKVKKEKVKDEPADLDGRKTFEK